MGPAFSSTPARALLSTLHPFPIHVPICLQRSYKGKGIPIWNLVIFTCVVASEGPAECMSIPPPEGFGVALLLFFRNSQQQLLVLSFILLYFETGSHAFYSKR